MKIQEIRGNMLRNRKLKMNTAAYTKCRNDRGMFPEGPFGADGAPSASFQFCFRTFEWSLHTAWTTSV